MSVHNFEDIAKDLKFGIEHLAKQIHDEESATTYFINECREIEAKCQVSTKEMSVVNEAINSNTSLLQQIQTNQNDVASTLRMVIAQKEAMTFKVSSIKNDYSMKRAQKLQKLEKYQSIFNKYQEIYHKSPLGKQYNDVYNAKKDMQEQVFKHQQIQTALEAQISEISRKIADAKESISFRDYCVLLAKTFLRYRSSVNHYMQLSKAVNKAQLQIENLLRTKKNLEAIYAELKNEIECQTNRFLDAVKLKKPTMISTSFLTVPKSTDLIQKKSTYFTTTNNPLSNKDQTPSNKTVIKKQSPFPMLQNFLQKDLEPTKCASPVIPSQQNCNESPMKSLQKSLDLLITSQRNKTRSNPVNLEKANKNIGDSSNQILSKYFLPTTQQFKNSLNMQQITCPATIPEKEAVLCATQENYCDSQKELTDTSEQITDFNMYDFQFENTEGIQNISHNLSNVSVDSDGGKSFEFEFDPSELDQSKEFQFNFQTSTSEFDNSQENAFNCTGNNLDDGEETFAFKF